MNTDGAIVTAVAAEYREILPVFIQEAREIIGHIPLQVSHLRRSKGGSVTLFSMNN
jgi:hypothetical protein